MSSPTATPPETIPPLPPPYAATVVMSPPRPAKRPGLALFLSLLFPGVGQLYNGQTSKAFTFFFAFVAAIYLINEIDPMPFAFFLPFIIFYGMIDAWRSATIINARRAGRPELIEEEEEDVDQSPIWGGMLVGVGLLLLLNNLGLFRLLALQRFWPLLLIAAGVMFLRRSLKRAEAKRVETASNDHGSIV